MYAERWPVLSDTSKTLWGDGQVREWMNRKICK